MFLNMFTNLKHLVAPRAKHESDFDEADRSLVHLVNEARTEDDLRYAAKMVRLRRAA